MENSSGKRIGLFTDESVPIVLSQVQKEMNEHPGNIWTHIISLRREDAERLGYNSPDAWMHLLRSQRNMIAQQMKIAPENFRWYAALHNEGHHPHVHMMAYSIKPTEQYLKTDIQKAISMFELAAEQGNSYAEYQLGKLYCFGQGVPQDLEAGMEWLRASASHGNEYAAQLLEKVENYIPEQECLRRREYLRPDVSLPLISPAVQNTLYKFCIRFAVVYDRNPIGHVFTLFRFCYIIVVIFASCKICFTLKSNRAFKA